MAEGGVERRLAAIVAIDVAGYSRLMGADEDGTLSALKGHREATTPIGERHGGRMVGTAGDGVLWEFPSINEAVAAALEVQALMAERNAGIPDDKQMLYRVGINLGDVMIDGDDIYGDGINVAARIEALADPGGICLSNAAYEQVRDRLDIAVDDLGEVEVKNIARPVRVFRVVSNRNAEAQAKQKPAPRPAPRKVALSAAIVALLVFAAGVLIWREPWRPAFNPALALPDKPSIAVLPFANMSDDPRQEYFADGMTEDLITDLSKQSGLFVIARNSVFTYKGKTVDVRRVAEELGVRYILEGSVRRAGDQVRINAQLIDASSGGHLWADRFDGGLRDVFALQDQVTAQIVASLAAKLGPGQGASTKEAETSVPEAYDAFLAGRRHFRQRSIAEYRMALTWYEKAVALDPDYARAWAALASVYQRAVDRGWTAQLKINPVRLPELLEKTLQRPTSRGYLVKSNAVLFKPGDEADELIDKASALDPNDPQVHVARSFRAAYRGNTDAAIASMKTAMRLDPHYPANYLNGLGAHYLRAGDAKTAIELLERAQARDPEDWIYLAFLTAAYVEAGRQQDAERTVQALIERRRDLGYLVTLIGNFDYWGILNGSFGDRVRKALVAAGIPVKARLEDLNLSPEYRLTGADLRERAKSGHRLKGRIPSGEWMTDNFPGKPRIYYWNGRKASTATMEIKGDTEFISRSTGQNYSCVYYRNPKGTKESLDEGISVCTTGVFPYAQFPLTE